MIVNVQIETTKRLLREALKSPNLDQPGRCAMTRNGKHCLVGQVLSDLGVPDHELRDDRDWWKPKAREFGLDTQVLEDAMVCFDSSAYGVERATELIKFLAPQVVE